MLLQSVILFLPTVPTALPWAMEFEEEGIILQSNPTVTCSNFSAGVRSKLRGEAE